MEVCTSLSLVNNHNYLVHHHFSQFNDYYYYIKFV